eukprot:scaffold10274_cov106-Isochrysis_galbana.AAC.1
MREANPLTKTLVPEDVIKSLTRAAHPIKKYVVHCLGFSARSSEQRLSMPASSLPPRIEVGGISASCLFFERRVPHRVCSPSLSPTGSYCCGGHSCAGASFADDDARAPSPGPEACAPSSGPLSKPKLRVFTSSAPVAVLPAHPDPTTSSSEVARMVGRWGLGMFVSWTCPSITPTNNRTHN